MSVQDAGAVELLPERSVFGPDDGVGIEVRGAAAPGRLTVWRLGELVAEQEHSGAGMVRLGTLPEGGYGIEYESAGGTARTAVEVAADRRRRLRYGFVVDYAPGRDVAPIADAVRRLHLTGVQFYDWAYRHAELLGGGEEYEDALGQPVSLATVRALVRAVQAAGAGAIGYAAVYGVGNEEWPEWRHRALLTAEGEAYGLGDFLHLVDPASEDWLAHFTGQLRDAVSRLGFDGFHLDQYGYPKRARRADGRIVDLAESFVRTIEGVRTALPAAQLVFNNVNDFPTWATAPAAQDAVYIEVWPPHVTLGSLARVVDRARSVAGGKPVVVAAYQSVYDRAPAASADLATAFTMATLYSHGATQLLAGEADRILVDPYYVRNHAAEGSTAGMLRRWYDFLVEHDELLLDPEIVDVTGAFAGEYNGDCDTAFAGVAVTETPAAGAVWRRIVRTRHGLVVHLINLVGQGDTLWDEAREPVGDAGAGTLRIRRIGGRMPRIRVADPDGAGRLLEVEVRRDGEHAVAELPRLGLWQLVLIDDGPADRGIDD